MITVANQKGGVGKTTTAVNLAASLVVAEKEVLLIDVDPQANATTGLSFNRNNYEYNIYHVFIGRKELSDIILRAELPQLHLAPSNIGLVGIEQELVKDEGNEKKMMLKRRLKEVVDKYDFIIIDSPPALKNIAINALVASDSVIIPTQCEFYALEGVATVLNTIKIIRKTINPKPKVRGFLPTVYSSQNNPSKDVVKDLKQNFKKQLFKMKSSEDDFIIIPRNVEFAGSPSFGKPIILYDIKSPGSLACRNSAYCILG